MADGVLLEIVFLKGQAAVHPVVFLDLCDTAFNADLLVEYDLIHTS
jgi:hypothetical protein